MEVLIIYGLVFWISDSMFSTAFESLSTSEPIFFIRAKFYSSRAFQWAQKCPKRIKNEGDMVIWKLDHDKENIRKRDVGAPPLN